LKVLGIIDSPTDPSSRIRIAQYVPWFKKAGIDLNTTYYSPLKDADPSAGLDAIQNLSGINKWRILNTVKQVKRIPLLVEQFRYDIIWQSRLLLHKHYSIERFYRKPFVFDFDDAIWINEGKMEVVKAIKKASLVFAGNPYLANFAMKFNKASFIIPTTIDTARIFPRDTPSTKFTIGWIGTKSNFPYLEQLQSVLIEFLNKYSDARLLIISSEPPAFFKFNNTNLVFKKWSAEQENDLLNEISVGIMPLPENEWTLGKCGYKLLQYMACNIPFIASPTGVNQYLIQHSNAGIGATSEAEWMKALTELKNNTAFYNALHGKGREFIIDNYNAETWSHKIIHLMMQI
jgi:glycosyltransferase involved in cell wall biosynthesis